MPSFEAIPQQAHMSSGPLIRSWPECPLFLSIQATGAPSGVTKSAHLIASACEGVRRAVTTLCTLQMHTVLLSLRSAQPKMHSTASLQLRTSTGTLSTSSRIRPGEAANSRIGLVSRWLRTKAANWSPAMIRGRKKCWFNCHSERSRPATYFVGSTHEAPLLGTGGVFAAASRRDEQKRDRAEDEATRPDSAALQASNIGMHRANGRGVKSAGDFLALEDSPRPQ